MPPAAPGKQILRHVILPARLEIQQRLAAEAWPAGGTVAVRIGLHAGAADLGHDNYIGLDVNRAARISAAGHGGQVVVSETVRALASGADYSDLGKHSLKGLETAEHLYQVDVPGLPQSFPPLRTRSARPNNLPALASRIIGREAEEAHLQELLAAHRLVTITGPGGIGKTRLALEVAKDVLTRFELGAFFVDLAPIFDPELVLPAIASAVGIDDSTNGGLAVALSDGERLLILFNLEQLAAAAPLLAALLAGAAPLTVLATSQVPLRLDGETVIRLAPLPSHETTSPAVELFVARACQADPSFDLAVHREDVLRLVEVLDGVPLAIELAAARMNVLNPAGVLERIDSGVLRSSRADTPDRHRSIAAAVEWSYGLLTRDQQELLQALSVFRGGATVAAIEAVVGRDALDDLAELVDRSLLGTESGATGKRFEMLAPVQLFARAQSPDHDAITARHATYFVQLAEDAHGPLDGDARARWIALLTDDHDNLRATLEHLIEGEELQRAYDMLGDIWRFFQSTGRLDELELWLARVFAADISGGPTVSRARALVARAALHYWRSDYRRAADDYEAALSIAETMDDRPLMLEVLGGITSTRGAALGAGEWVGDLMESGERLQTLAAELDDPVGLAQVEFLRAVTAIMGHPESVAQHLDLFERIIGFQKRAGRLMDVAHTQIGKSEIEIGLGKYDQARETALLSLETAERAGDLVAMAWGLQRFAITEVELGDPILGARLAGASWAARQRSGGTFPPPFMPIDDPEVRARAAIGQEADRAFCGRQRAGPTGGGGPGPRESGAGLREGDHPSHGAGLGRASCCSTAGTASGTQA